MTGPTWGPEWNSGATGLHWTGPEPDESPLSASLVASDGTSTQVPPSDHLGACGHELDAWETHLEHHPECPRDVHGHPYEGCTCPEVCAGCCLECRELDSTIS